MTAELNENNGESRKINVYNLIILIISAVSTVGDLLIGSIVMIQYYIRGDNAFALFTLSLLFFPTVIIQSLSVELHVKNNNAKPLHWFLHSILLGVFHRYYKGIQIAHTNLKSKNYDQEVSINDLNNLFFYKSFLLCVPQLVLQLYVLCISDDWLFSTGLLILVSIFSIIWSLTLQTKWRSENVWPRLVCLIVWRIGMITARLSALVLGIYMFGPWIILIIGAHFVAMVIWTSYQQTSLSKKEGKGKLHTAVCNVIYCFCYFSLQIGRSRWKGIILNISLFFENLILLIVFLMRFSGISQRLAVASFVMVAGGDLIGMSSFLIYIVCLNRSKLIRCLGLRRDSKKEFVFNEGGLYALRPIRRKKEKEAPVKEIQSPSDSIVIIEENPTYHVKDENAAVPEEIIYETPKRSQDELKMENAKLSAALKRRAICSSVDLSRFIEGKSGNVDEAISEISSTHDYENLCAVNIAREPWGLRSWRSYSDIETWRHDDSVVNDRRTDNMTTSSEYSCKVEDALNDDLMQCEVDTNSDVTSVYFVPPLSMLDTIVEEGSGEDEPKAKCNSESALVATIDKICLYTPYRSRSIENSNRGILKSDNRIVQLEESRYKAQKSVAFRQTNFDTRKSGKENVTVEGSKTPNLREKTISLMQKLTPTKSQKRTFHVNSSNHCKP